MGNSITLPSSSNISIYNPNLSPDTRAIEDSNNNENTKSEYAKLLEEYLPQFNKTEANRSPDLSSKEFTKLIPDSSLKENLDKHFINEDIENSIKTSFLDIAPQLLSSLEFKTKDQQIAIEQRLISIKNTASRGSTSIQSLKNEITSSLHQNNTEKDKLMTLLEKASQTGEGNYSLIQSYQKTLRQIENYSKIMSSLEASLKETFGLFNQIEAKTDLISADINQGIQNFQTSVLTNKIRNDFSPALNIINELINSIHSPEANFQTNIESAEQLIVEFKSRINELENYLEGPQNRKLYPRTHDEFKEEIAHLNTHIAFLERFFPILKSYDKTRHSLLRQFNELLEFAAELEETQLTLVLNAYKASEEKSQNFTYNGEDLNLYVKNK